MAWALAGLTLAGRCAAGPIYDLTDPVGPSLTLDGQTSAFLFDPGTGHDPNSLLLNPSAMIVGYGASGGRSHAQVVSPSVAPAVPEPETLGLLGLGAGALLLRRRRSPRNQKAR